MSIIFSALAYFFNESYRPLEYFSISFQRNISPRIAPVLFFTSGLWRRRSRTFSISVRMILPRNELGSARSAFSMLVGGGGGGLPCLSISALVAILYSFPPLLCLTQTVVVNDS